ncbi:hypothetical protein MUN89_18150 [Halobacillus salinarum]|uniref:Uncharacterized protein n=1 Tax=Halobacillus salinarum TaxID=2932257 RepID=A0ABY4ENV5_9BACI|nr:hypothetical protein [Halobacillus salinarum]UOQ43781.1 hypothetical protein MUN89_18150 [Halobacillus salinarum]
MEMIERYIYSVMRRLPQSQRSDIGEELRSLIEDMLLERGTDQNPSEKDVEAVLLELGPPHELALKYGGQRRYLISPELFYFYQIILKIVLVSALVGLSSVFIIEAIINPMDILSYFVDYIVSLVQVGPQAFAWVTLAFALMEYKGIVPDELKKERSQEWSPSQLPAVPDRKKQIKKGETIFGIIVSVFVLIFVIQSNDFIGLPVFANDQLVTIVPFFNLEHYSSFLVLIIIIIGLGILKECVKLLIGKWTKKLAASLLLINLVILVLGVFLLQYGGLWNPEFLQQFSDAAGFKIGSEAYAAAKTIWQQAKLGVLVVFIATVIIETAAAYFKAYRK